MRRRFTVIVTCLLVTSVYSTDLSSGYDPGSHGSSHDDGSADGYGANGPQPGPDNRGNNEWTPLVGPGPSANDRVIYHGNGHKTLVAGSPTSPIAESIDYHGPPPSPPIQASHNQGYQYPPAVPQVPVGYGVETNQIHAHHESHQVPTKTIINQIHAHHESHQVPTKTIINQIHAHHESHQVPTKTIINTIKVPVPQPYKVLVDKKVPYKVKVPVHVKVPRPVHVPVPRPIQVPVDKPYEVIVERQVPYEVRVPVEVPVKVPYHVEVPQPYPVPVVVPKPVIIKHPVPVVIKFIKEREQGLFG